MRGAVNSYTIRSFARAAIEAEVSGIFGDAQFSKRRSLLDKVQFRL